MLFNRLRGLVAKPIGQSQIASVEGFAGLKCKMLTGTTAAAQGGTASLSHGLTGSKIVSITSVVIYAANSGISPEYARSGGFQYSLSYDANNVSIENSASNSSSILSKSVSVLVWYTA